MRFLGVDADLGWNMRQHVKGAKKPYGYNEGKFVIPKGQVHSERYIYKKGDSVDTNGAQDAIEQCFDAFEKDNVVEC